MAFRDFAYPEVQTAFGLTLTESDLFGHVGPVAPTAEFTERLRSGVDLALAVGTEKARSEFIIAPVLLELRRIRGGTFGLFSGVEFNVDAARGLNGFCDFLLTRSPLQSVLTAPVVAVVEAKNDNLRSGLGQCVASVVAAREFNAQSPGGPATTYGVVTTGASWKFLALGGEGGAQLALDRREYFVTELGQVLGILSHIVSSE